MLIPFLLFYRVAKKEGNVYIITHGGPLARSELFREAIDTDDFECSFSKQSKTIVYCFWDS